MKVEDNLLEYLCVRFLREIGEDPGRDGLKDTPRRWSKMWKEFFEYEDPNINSVFDSKIDEMVVVNGVRVWSFCEHHLLPFWCDVSMAYLPTGKVIGLSKFARIAHRCAHRLQIQERLCEEIADELQRISGSEDVAVLGRGVHLCMLMRGIKTKGELVTSIVRGRFRTKPGTKAEFLKMVELEK